MTEHEKPNPLHTPYATTRPEGVPGTGVQPDGTAEPFPPQPGYNPYLYPNPSVKPPRGKSKFLAALLALMVPGLGHFYIGYMQRGVMVMLAFILGIVSIVQISTGPNMSASVVTLLALLLPVIYFYNVFDALQLVDRLRAHQYGYYSGHPAQPFPSPEEPIPFQALTKGNRAGWLLIGVGALFFFLSNKPSWLTSAINTGGSYIGAVILIAAGAYLFLRSSDSK
ncbi:DUF6677 family protein [Paenibacillus koleovorans]|uniref:DUF6677 family protein n=1 Tax=Paenibacillus koleovorans TaxID=121608 RepID=UPI000FD9B60D|nr:DUF6677 family protein [Paenibacillus koleovorans]